LSFSIGIDVGSTTLKTVVLNAEGEIIEKSYQRHLSRVREVTAEHIRSLKNLLEGQMLKISVTGSAGLGVAENAGLGFVQEVFAAAGAVNRQLPETDVVIELGGEDAKIIFLRGTLEERMNGSCAGGTGAFIDQMATLLNLTVDELDEVYRLHKRIYPIASRCGVFAKSDIQSLMNQGAKKEDIAASIFQAVVDQTIGGLAQGRAIKGNVLFLGGPLSFFKGLQDRFIKTLGLDKHNAVFPELAPYFMALGSAFNAEKNAGPITYDELISQLERPPTNTESATNDNETKPLFANEAEREEFSRRHGEVIVPEADIATYSGEAFLGIDAGSTTTKLTLIGENDEILYKHYSPNGGNPLPIIREQIQQIYARQAGSENRRHMTTTTHPLKAGNGFRIAGAAVTGYGEELVQAAFGIDHGIVETIAHFTAARHFNRDVDFIIDIGGQDIKCFHIKDGAVDSVVLNEACSSGCGSFLETFATSLGYSVADFANVALAAKNPVDLGSRCTVFMNSSFKQAQKDGATIEDIAAGLAMSVVKNALYKVIRVRDSDELGQNIVVQGGTFLNDAVLRCFETEIGRDVVRLPISELMGAYGAALFAKHNAPEVTNLISPDALENFTHKSKSTICNACPNKCCVTINTFADGSSFISGNKCERGAGKKENGTHPDGTHPNLVAFKYDFIMNYPAYGTGRKKIGLPLVMNMYETIPFWSTFFSSLGCDVILSEPSSRELYMKGQHTIASDTICYPAKLGHGHVESLIEKGVDAIFYPCQTYNIDEGISDNCYNCPVVAYYPEVIAANINTPAPIINLHIGFRDKKKFTSRIFAELKKLLPDLKMGEIKLATARAFESYDAYSRHVAEYGEHAIAYAKTHGLPVIVLACRPYHIDPEINHGIDKLLCSMGFVVVTEDAVAHHVAKQKLDVLNQWTYHARLYNAAKFVTQNENMELVQLVSFGCGIDAITTDEVAAILRSAGKLYTQIKIDEIKNLGAAKIRLRSLEAARKARGKHRQNMSKPHVPSKPDTPIAARGNS